MENIPGHAVDVVPVSKHQQIVMLMQTEFYSLQKSSAIVVDLTSHERTVLALSLWFLWNLSVLYYEGSIPEQIPCILLGKSELPAATCYPFVRVSPSQSGKQLQDFFLNVLNTPATYVRGMHEFKPLSNKERQVINLCLSGVPLSRIAEHMQITYCTVSGYRQSALRKIGLKNRNEYMLLTGMTFL
ncbi:helix-turn-helix transcriptional regulator [Escherichia coli]|uniref:helix-turn-helix transcriptional regulator n=1 Tax=Escherichia coli TaxID=562 RepID=UPI001917B5A9|nr:helix-turn-helix transcriptional regulator [Escherichia coli]